MKNYRPENPPDEGQPEKKITADNLKVNATYSLRSFKKNFQDRTRGLVPIQTQVTYMGKDGAHFRFRKQDGEIISLTTPEDITAEPDEPYYIT